jgi:hypothetical protein
LTTLIQVKCLVIKFCFSLNAVLSRKLGFAVSLLVLRQSTLAVYTVERPASLSIVSNSVAKKTDSPSSQHLETNKRRAERERELNKEMDSKGGQRLDRHVYRSSVC